MTWWFLVPVQGGNISEVVPWRGELLSTIAASRLIVYCTFSEVPIVGTMHAHRYMYIYHLGRCQIQADDSSPDLKKRGLKPHFLKEQITAFLTILPSSGMLKLLISDCTL